MNRVDKTLSSKIEIPTVYSHVLQRTNMVCEIKHSLSKVTVLNAGAGFGKTMLLLLYAKSLEGHCAWYSLGSMDNDLMLFMSYLTKAIQKVIPNFNFSIEEYLNAKDEEANRKNGEIRLGFIRALSEINGFNLFLIFDDFQEIKNEEIICIISSIIQYTPDNIRILISVKGAFPQFLAKFLIQNLIHLYTIEQLAFTKEEIKALVEENCYLELSDATVDKIHEVTQGWPAGVMFTVLAIKQQGIRLNPEEVQEICMQQTVYDYLTYELYRKLPYEIQKFLANTSVLHILSVDVCNVVMDISNSKSILDYLVQENLFTLRVSIKESVYRYHSIFQGFLQTQLSEEDRIQILEKAAYYYLQKSDQVQAAEYGIMLDNAEIVETAVAQIGMRLMDQGQMQKLHLWLKYLLDCNYEVSADCKFVIARYERLQKEYEEAECYIADAASEFKKEKREKDYVAAVYENATILRKQSATQEALKLLKDTLKEGIIDSAEQYLLQFYIIEYELLLSNIETADETAKRLYSWKLSDRQKKRLGRYIEAIELYLKYRQYIIDGKEITQDLNETQAVGQASKIIRDYLIWICLYRAYCEEDERFLTQVMKAEEDSLLSEDNGYSLLIELIVCLCSNNDGTTANREKYSSLLTSLGTCSMAVPKLRTRDEELLQNLSRKKGQDKLTINSSTYLNVYCFGGFQIRIGSERIKWRTKKSMELFAYLYDRQGALVSKDVIEEALWPEVDPEKGSNLFHTTLSYVRKALSNQNMQNVIITVNKQYGLDMKLIKSDCKILMQINDNIKKKNYELFQNKEKILGIYRGAYMEGEEYPWADGKAEYYERMYLWVCEELASYCMKHEKMDQALYCLHEEEKFDPYSERNLQMRLECYYRLGDIKRLKVEYEKAHELYNNDLGVDLGDKIKEYYLKCTGKG